MYILTLILIQDGRTALMLASLEGKTDVVKLLLNHNADVNAKHKVRAVLVWHTRPKMQPYL